MDKINLNSYHPILDIQGHTVFASNGNVVLCYKVDFPEVYSLSFPILMNISVYFRSPLRLFRMDRSWFRSWDDRLSLFFSSS